MKNTFASFLLLALSAGANAQQYEFQPVIDIPCSKVISQGNTGTCWSFSTVSFLEAEILRKTGKAVDLSEMYNVRKTYEDKAFNFVMRQGHAQFGEGGLAHDVINSAKHYGLVPESVYTGLPDGARKHDHSKMAEKLEALLKKYAASEKLTPEWRTQTAAVLNENMGAPVETFTFGGKDYTPATFAASLQLDWDDYVTITSFSHEAPYSRFILPVADNFSNGSFYNLPLDEYIANIDHALENGFTLSLDADVSEPYFFKEGIAVVPAEEGDKKAAKEIRPELSITASHRQQEYESFSTTDDHLMHIVGKVKDQKGNVYYKVKNSWGADKGRDGYVYMSVAYMRLKSISVLLSKDGLIKKTRKALSL